MAAAAKLAIIVAARTTKYPGAPIADTAPPLASGPKIEPRPNSKTNPAAAETRFCGVTASLVWAAEMAYIGKISAPMQNDEKYFAVIEEKSAQIQNSATAIPPAEISAIVSRRPVASDSQPMGN